MRSKMARVARVKLFLLGCFFWLHGDDSIIVIDPAGHAGDGGRWLVQGYERAQTLRFAHALKDALAEKYKVHSVVARSSGEKILPLQIPSFSNRLDAKFFLRLNLYHEESEKPKLFFYHLLFDSFVDSAGSGNNLPCLTPLHQAHFANVGRTRIYGSKMYEYLNQNYFKRYFDCYPLRGIPLKHLIGICAPAVLLEIGICRENKWESLVRPIVDSLSFLAELGQLAPIAHSQSAIHPQGVVHPEGAEHPEGVTRPQNAVHPVGDQS